MLIVLWFVSDYSTLLVKLVAYYGVIALFIFGILLFVFVVISPVINHRCGLVLHAKLSLMLFVSMVIFPWTRLLVTMTDSREDAAVDSQRQKSKFKEI